MSMFFTVPARAFIFSDIAALGQRAAQFLQTAQHYVASVTHFQEVVKYAQEFQAYKNQFASYQRNFDRVYKKIDRGDYWRDFNVSNWDWKRLDDHIIRTWRSYNQAFYDAQVLSLRTSRLFETNPVYRRYAERLIALSQEKIESIKEEEAFAQATEDQIKARRDVLEKLRESNENLSTDDEASSIHLQAMQNRIQMEIVAMMLDTNLIEQRQRRLEQELSNYFIELQEMLREAQQNDARNIEYILESTTTK